ncbi:DUF397 domain-containing protein [Actinoallomurus purpureus]
MDAAVTITEWRKSRYSSPNGGDCVEIAVASSSEVGRWNAGQA